jgi:molecular chaperone GrpE
MDNTPPEADTPEAPIADATPDAPAAETAPAETAPLDPLAEAQAEAAKWRDQAYRHAAELDNFRKRMARETQEARQYANADLLRSLLPIMDNFDMGLESARLENDKSIIYIGMNMVARQMSEFLKEMGVTEVESSPGAAFDPHQHEAISQEASAEIAEGSILRVARRGFKLKDRLLRAANVVVSSGPAQDTPAA